MLDALFRRNRFLLVLDAILLVSGLGLAVALRFEFSSVPDAVAKSAAFYGLIVVPAKLLVLFLGGLYRRLWRNASVVELSLVAVFSGVASLVGLGIGAMLVAFPSFGYRPPLSIIGFDALATLLIPMLPRAGLRIREHLRLRPLSDARPVLVAGAGAAGQLIVKEILSSPRMRMRPVGFVDDDPTKRGKVVVGVPVLGPVADIGALCRRRRIESVLIAMPSAGGEKIREIVSLATANGVQTRTVPSLFELLEGRTGITNVREVRIEDLLRRSQVETDLGPVAAVLRDQVVLVTGAGGSIGSELCRQIAAIGPSRLVILGHGENSIFEIQQELIVRYPGMPVAAAIADVRDRSRIMAVIEQYRPHAVFHAAAHKHVPLMEENVVEAVTNNVVGTQNVVDASLRAGVPHFVMISTDKAVRPTSVMGATKRIAEQVVQLAALRAERRYVAVRFGNVLGSRGSVVPTFLRQIRAGGPVTVTHPEMRRFFMTIPEASQLVLQAGALGTGAEVFVLDMGEPVRVQDLANDLIRLSGLEPGRDIDVVFTGMRPGEKLYEEMFFSNEEAVPTAHPKILRAKKAGLSEATPRRIQSLIEAALEGQPADDLRRRIHSLVPDARLGGIEVPSGSHDGRRGTE